MKRRGLTLASAAVGAAAVVFWFVQHVRAELVLPTPWPDESAFLFPAVALLERGTLLAPELNPERPLLWMPPGYFFTLAAWFLFAPATLESARWFSWVAVSSSLALFAASTRREAGVSWHRLLLTAAPATPALVLMANVARMEACVLLVTSAAAALLAFKRPWAAFAAACACPLFHPISAGVPAAFFGAALAFTPRGWPRRGEWALLAAVALAWLAYAGWVTLHLDFWLRDMAFQRQLKADDWRTRSWAAWEVGFFASTLAALGVALVRRQPRPLLVCAAALQVPSMVSTLFWYEPLRTAGVFLLATEALGVAGDGATRWLHSGWARAAVVVSLWALLLRVLWLNGVVEQPGHFDSLEWRCFHMSDAPYLLENEERQLLERLPSAGRISFARGGEAFLFASKLPGQATPMMPLFTSLTPDVAVFHSREALDRCEPISTPEGVRWAVSSDRAWTLVDLRPAPARAPGP